MGRTGIGVVLAWLSLGIGILARGDHDVLSGSRRVHIVRAGESLSSVGARFGIEPRVIAATNFLPADAWLRLGQWIVIDDRHIVPAPQALDEIVVNIPQRMLFHFADGALVGAYPVAVGHPASPTFVGAFRVSTLETDPVWDVPLSIQAEQRAAGKEVLTHVPPGPTNPLGRHWIGLTQPGYGIHGTNAPWSIYGFRTHGCIRLHPDDIAALFRSTRLGMAGRVIYEPVLLAETATQRILLEIHPDPYRRQPDVMAAVYSLSRQLAWTFRIDWDKVRLAVRDRDGTPRDVTYRPPTARTVWPTTAGIAPARGRPRTDRRGGALPLRFH